MASLSLPLALGPHGSAMIKHFFTELLIPVLMLSLILPGGGVAGCGKQFVSNEMMDWIDQIR